MFTHIEIKNFRSFADLSASGFARINLLVGANNSGKTSLLDAVSLLLSDDPTRDLWFNAYNRREYLNQDEVEVSHLFHGHALEAGQRFSLQADAHELNGEIVPGTSEPGSDRVDGKKSGRRTERGGYLLDLLIRARAGEEAFSRQVPLTQAGTLERQPPVIQFRLKEKPTYWISPNSDFVYELSSLWNKVALTPEEAFVVESLRTIEPEIERLAFLNEGGTENIYVRLKNSDKRIPLGSMGDGMRRILAMALNLANAAGGYLLVDEIDTGLHHSVMLSMWRLIIETARRLNIQVFATTHSSDCVRALAWLYEEQPEIRDEIAVHRVQRGLTSTVRYSADELLVAARQHIEVR